MSLSKYATPILIVGMALLALLPFMPPYFYVNRDSGIFLYGGQEIAWGKTLYVDFWDHKGPLLFYINALGILLGQRTGVWFLQCFFLSVSALAGYQFCQKIFGSRMAIWATFAWLYSFTAIIGGGNFSEEYSLPFNFLSILLFDLYIQKEKRLFLLLLGLLIGLNIFLRPNNIGIQLVIVGIAFFNDIFSAGIFRFVKSALSISLGVLLVILPTFLFFYSQNAFSQFFDAVFLFNINYANDPAFVKFSSLPIFIVSLGWPCWFALIGWAILLVDFLRKQQHLPQHIALLFLIGLPLELLIDSLSGRPYPHYVLMVLPYLGFLNAFFLQRLLKFLTQSQNKLLRLALLAVGALTVFLSLAINIVFVKTLNAVNPNLTENSEIVQYVKTHTAQTDTILVWGQLPSINFLAGRESPTKYAHQTFLFINGVSTARMRETFLSALNQNKPELIIITSELPFSTTFDAAFEAQLKPFLPEQHKTFSAFSAFVQKNYLAVKSIQEWNLYRLRH